MSNTSGPRKKSWHESKHLRKRAAFLLEDPDFIPTDVCFRIRMESGKIKEVRGHKIFFALGSPVFYAMFYGDLKEGGNVEIVDVTFDAFLCLKRYIYTDSFDGMSVDNMIDVLFASKKYLMAKLTRYCYEFIQKNITAENAVSLWCQAEDAFDETVAEQCASEIKRNTGKAVSSEDFLKVSKNHLLEITSWQNITIGQEFDLYQAVKNWRRYQESTTGILVPASRHEGGIFQNIRFAMFTPEQLAADNLILDEIFTADDLKQIFRYKTCRGRTHDF